MKYPKSVFFIVSNEFCERFSYYGMRTVLPLYMVERLQYSEITATVMLHTFAMLAYFFPLIGAIIADSWLGKYHTILYLSVLYVIGQLLLSASSTPWFQFSIREMSLLGLLLIAIGTGGIKPCVASFGGEQFKLPEQKAYVSNYFTVFYISINCGALLSTLITPILRKDVTCFNFNSCYPLAFFVPLALMILALGIFVAGKRMYKRKNPEGNVLLQVTSCIWHAVRRKMNSRETRSHWLDYADDTFDHNIIDDTKSVLRVLKLFIPLPFFWALHDQQASRWTFQATRMDGEFFGYLLKPDQFLLVNPVLIIGLLPVFDWVIYPIIKKFLFINTPLRKITVGGVLTATSFVVSGLLELHLEPTYAVQPSVGHGQIRIFNTLNCPANLLFNGQDYKLEELGLYQNLSIPVTGNKSLSYDLKVVCSSTTPFRFTGSVNVEEDNALTYVLRNDGLHTGFSDIIKKSRSGDPKVRAAIFEDTGTPANLSILLESSKSYELESLEDHFATNFIEVKHNSYNISIDGVQVAKNILLKTGGVYTITGQVSINGSMDIKIITVVEPNSVRMFWLLPQYIIITVGEIMFSVTGLEFAFSQAPVSMKSLMQAIWLLSTAIGNLLVIIIAKARFFNRQVLEFFLFAGIMYVDVIIFAILAKSYKYAYNSQNNSCEYEQIEMKEQYMIDESTKKILKEKKHESELQNVD